MLIISRKKNESIIINDDISVYVVEIRGDKVRLAVEAPKEVPVHKNEIYEMLRRNTGHSEVAEQDGRIRERIAELRQEISKLESQLSDAAPSSLPK